MISALVLALALLLVPDVSRRRLDVPKVRVHNHFGLRVGVAVVGAVGLAALLGLLALPAALAGIVVLATVLIRHGRARRRRRQLTESAALQGALGMLVGELRAGAHPVTAFESAATEVDDPVAAALREVAARARLGADVATGLLAVAVDSSLPAQWERLAVYWQLARDHGLAIAALMHAAERDVVARERFSSRARSGMAGARATAAVLAGLPVLGIGLGQLIGAHPVRFLLGDGAVVLLIGVTLSCAGLLWSDRITAVVLR
jgi:tight adherence protein B